MNCRRAETMVNVTCLLLMISLCATIASTFDLGNIVRIAQCRSQCLRKHSTDGSCDWFSSRRETVCSECWQNCEAVETQWQKAKKSICEGEQYSRCPACQTACTYRNTRIEEEYPPSMLPAPQRGPLTLDKFDVAVVMRRVHKEWRECGYYPGRRVPALRPDTWIIAVTKDGVRHYSWQEWVPTLESLKEGALYEATITWRDMSLQLRRQRQEEQKRFNDRVRQFFLEKYGEKVLAEWRSQEDSHISEEVFRRFFFRRRDEEGDDASLERDASPSTNKDAFDDDDDENDENDDGNAIGDGENSLSRKKKNSFVISWEPETGGLMGNQVTDSNSAQISLLPGTKYLVRVASNDGPGSFPIEVDTRPGSVQVRRVKRNFVEFRGWDVYAACASAVVAIIIVILVKALRRKKSAEIEEV